jgi:capsular polysaccharide transport system permease protein
MPAKFIIALTDRTIMDLNHKPIVQIGQKTALEHAKNVSTALKEAARRARFSKRSKRASGADGFKAGRRARLISLAMLLSFFLVFLIPSLTIASYYTFFASNQYVSEAQFTVAGSIIPNVDGFPSLGGIPAIAIIQDTQIVTNYVTSRAALEKLDEKVKLRQLYSKSTIDWYARFESKKSIEKFINYWKGMVSASIKMPSGIVTLQVKAFSPEDAKLITQALVADSEHLINEMDQRMHKDAVQSAEQQVTTASARLADTRLALENARNNSGILDAVKTADSINAILNNVRSGLLQLQQEYQTQLKAVSANAPQMRLLKSRIDATAIQIEELEAKLTQKPGSIGSDPTISSAVSRFAELNLEHKIAERLYAGALTALEVARLTAQKRTMYLTTFIQPQAPQDAEYPRRITTTLMAVFICLIIWGLICLVLSTVRKRLL